MVFKLTDSASRFQHKNVSNFAGLVWNADFRHFFGNILGLGAYTSKQIFALKPWVWAGRFEVAKRCQKMPKVAKRCQRLPKVAKSYQKMPKGAKSCQKLLNVAKSCKKLQKVAKRCQMLPNVAKWCQMLPKVANFETCYGRTYGRTYIRTGGLLELLSQLKRQCANETYLWGGVESGNSLKLSNQMLKWSLAGSAPL